MRQNNGLESLMDAGWEDAIKRGDVQHVRDLLDRGTNVDSRDRHGQTALMLAAHAGHREVVEALIAHRANLNTTAKYGLSALMLALIAGHAEVVRLLANAGTDLSVRGTGAPGFAGKTAYDLAIERDMLELSAALKPKPSSATRR
jgi:uncharacterized protein